MLANQNNAQLSTGPRTEAGKARVSQNAAAHGLTSKQFVLASEDQAAYEEMRSGVFESWRPATEQERQLAELLAQAQWRLMRVRRTAFLDQCINEILEEHPELDADQALALIFTSPVHTKRLSLFLRYQTSIERACNRAFADLEKAQKLRRQRESEQAVAEAWQAAEPETEPKAEREADAAAPEPAEQPRVGFVSLLSSQPLSANSSGVAPYGANGRLAA
jgi:hypothetical protein